MMMMMMQMMMMMSKIMIISKPIGTKITATTRLSWLVTYYKSCVQYLCFDYCWTKLKSQVDMMH